mgnify:CR=1 FL=1
MSNPYLIWWWNYKTHIQNYNMKLEINDLNVLKGALESISIKGKDAKYISGLIDKLENLTKKQEIELQEKSPTKSK